MSDIFPPTKQRPALLKLAAALGSRPSALRRDECGDWRIEGHQGYVYAVPGGFSIFVLTETARAWTYAQRALSFATLAQDGDTEGSLFLDRLPTNEEAKIIRRACGIPKRVERSEATIAAMRERLAKVRSS